MPSQSRGETFGGRGEQRKAQDQVEHDFRNSNNLFVVLPHFQIRPGQII
jgi:hypothetical protein